MKHMTKGITWGTPSWNWSRLRMVSAPLQTPLRLQIRCICGHAQQGQVAFIMSQRVDAKLLDKNAIAALKMK